MNTLNTKIKTSNEVIAESFRRLFFIQLQLEVYQGFRFERCSKTDELIEQIELVMELLLAGYDY